MSSWGDVAYGRNQDDIDEYIDEDRGDVRESIWDWHNQQDYAQNQNDLKDQQDDARASWGDAANPPDEQDLYAQGQQAKEQRRGPGSRGGTPAAFQHGQTSTTYPGGIDQRRAKRKINQVRHPIETGKKEVLKKAKKKSWWPGTKSHSFHNPNGQR